MIGRFPIYLTFLLVITHNIVGAGASSDDDADSYSSCGSFPRLTRSLEVTSNDLATFAAVEHIRHLSNQILAHEIGLSKAEADRCIEESKELYDADYPTDTGIFLEVASCAGLVCPWGRITLESELSSTQANNHFERLRQSLDLKFSALTMEKIRYGVDESTDLRTLGKIFKGDGTEIVLSEDDIAMGARPGNFPFLDRYRGTSTVILHPCPVPVRYIGYGSIHEVAKIKKDPSRGLHQDIAVPPAKILYGYWPESEAEEHWNKVKAAYSEPELK
jgi:hypothetical protein